MSLRLFILYMSGMGFPHCHVSIDLVVFVFVLCFACISQRFFFFFFGLVSMEVLEKPRGYGG